MKILRILSILTLLLVPIPFGIYLVNDFFYESSKTNLFHGDILMNEVPSDYHPKNRGFWFTLPDGPCQGAKMFFRDSIHGEGRPTNTIVFVHGNPTSSYTFRNVIKSLTTHSRTPLRIISMDHIGFGLSDRAQSLLTPYDHSNNLLQLFKYLDLERITLVVHDWGGPIGIGAFLNFPETVNSLIVLNSIVLPIPETEFIIHKYAVPVFANTDRISLMPDFLYSIDAAYSILCAPSSNFFHKTDMIKDLVFSSQAISNGIDPAALNFFKKHLTTTQNIQNSKFLYQQVDSFPKDDTSSALINDTGTGKLIAFIEENISEKWGLNGQKIVAFGLFGGMDILSNDLFTDKWKEGLPQLKGHIKILDNTGHHIQEEQPEIVSATILKAISNVNLSLAPVENKSE